MAHRPHSGGNYKSEAARSVSLLPDEQCPISESSKTGGQAPTQALTYAIFHMPYEIWHMKYGSDPGCLRSNRAHSSSRSSHYCPVAPEQQQCAENGSDPSSRITRPSPQHAPDE